MAQVQLTPYRYFVFARPNLDLFAQVQYMDRSALRPSSTAAGSPASKWETAKHVILQFTSERQALRRLTSTTNFQQLTSNHRAAAVLAPWFLRLGLLPQFSWAQDQLPPA